MSNIDYSEKHLSYAPLRSPTGERNGRAAKKKIQLVVNVTLIAAAFLFVGAAVLGIFP
nr:hypothetical protein [uncultured Gellertiella sp.]